MRWSGRHKCECIGVSNRSVSHDRGDHIEVVVYRDGIETTRTTKPKKVRETPQPGDALEEFLTSYGITKEWWTEYKSQHGLPPTCGCDSRREYLNDLSKAHPNLAKYGVMVFRALTRKKP